MPVLPLVGSMITVSLVILPGLFAGVDHRHADAILHRPERVEVLQLGDHLGVTPARDASQPDQRRIADRLRDVIIDTPTTRTRFSRRHDSLPPYPDHRDPAKPTLSSENRTRFPAIPTALRNAVGTASFRGRMPR